MSDGPSWNRNKSAYIFAINVLKVLAKHRYFTLLFCVLLIIACLIAGEPLLQALSQNILVLKMLLPFVVIFGGLTFLNSKGYLKGRVDTYLTVSSILLAILFFIFNNFQLDSQKVTILAEVDNYNCKLASTTVQRLVTTPNTIVAQDFFTDVYEQNLNFEFQKRGEIGLEQLQQKIFVLSLVNGAISVGRSTGATAMSSQYGGTAAQFVLDQNKIIKEWLYAYHQNFCL